MNRTGRTPVSSQCTDGQDLHSVGAYRAALEVASATCRSVARSTLGVSLAPIVVQLRAVEAGEEVVWTDYAATVVFEFSDVAQFRPPPLGTACLYGLTHEIGHLVVAAARRGRLPAVVWDEALAHHLATELFLPSLWDVHGASLWPGGYDGYHVAEGRALLDGRSGSPLSDHAVALRRMDSVILRIRRHGGWAELIAGLREVDDRDLGPLRFPRALERRVQHR